VLGVLLALKLSLILAKKFKVSTENIFDLAFWLIIFGIIGARIYHIFLEIEYYIAHPADIIKIWEGGMAIHGAVIAGIITILIFCHKKKMNFWLTTAILTPGLALCQAIGRWGNYFNQELFGLPTDLAWGIPINIIIRPPKFIDSQYFHPTFLYESLGNLFIFAVLICLLWYFFKKGKKRYDLVVITYLIMYSTLRFFMEFIRIDKTPEILNLRFPQIASIIIILACFVYLFQQKYKKT